MSILDRVALRAAKSGTNELKLEVATRVIVGCEKKPGEVSDRLPRDLRQILNSIKQGESSTPEEIVQAVSLLKRIPAFDPRRLKRIADQVDDDGEENEVSERPSVVTAGPLKRHEDTPVRLLTPEQIKSVVFGVDAVAWKQFRKVTCKRAGLMQPGDFDLSPEQRTAVLKGLLGALPLDFSGAEALSASLLMARLRDARRQRGQEL